MLQYFFGTFPRSVVYFKEENEFLKKRENPKPNNMLRIYHYTVKIRFEWNDGSRKLAKVKEIFHLSIKILLIYGFIRTTCIPV